MTSTTTQIKASEIRHGNYVNVNLIEGHCIARIDIGRCVKAFVATGEHKDKEVNFFRVDSENNSPIPLTSELLEKCGFESTTQLLNDGKTRLIRQEKDIDEYTILTAYIDGNDSLTFVLEQKPQRKVYAASDIQRITFKDKGYLHQLQNLYFAITGEELTVNL